jgi:hypothetical protein
LQRDLIAEPARQAFHFGNEDCGRCVSKELSDLEASREQACARLFKEREETVEVDVGNEDVWICTVEDNDLWRGIVG